MHLGPVTALELSPTYFPKGFAVAGLTPKSLPLSWRQGNTVAGLVSKVERWEHRRGNPDFELRIPARVPAPLAFEMAQAYVALRERFPAVAPEYFNLASEMGNSVLATAWTYASDFPLLRNFGLDTLEGSDFTELREQLDTTERRRLTRELQLAQGTARNPLTAGGIDMCDLFASRGRYADLIRFWNAKNRRAALAGRPLRIPELRTSAATMVLVHEFGHLVDAELIDADREAAKHVYAALSYCVFGEWPSSERQWRYHLWNYPTYSETVAGAAQGGARRRQSNRNALRKTIGHALTRYAAASRDEIFAEAFALSFCATNPQRRSLAPFTEALRDVGMLRRAR